VSFQVAVMPEANDGQQPDPNPIVNGPDRAPWWLLLAHGAGQGPETPFMEAIAGCLGAAGVRVIRFRFPYLRIGDGKRRPPNPEAVLREAFLAEIAALGIPAQRLLIGGKSMGGRMASLIADQAGVAGLLCLGYPFHPPGKPEQLRIKHLRSIRTPTLICQGERDPFGRRAEVAGYALSEAVTLKWITDGEHSFKPRKASGLTWQDNLAEASAAAESFIADRLSRAAAD
jgi:predicted alpha/beta-hydrolase family hydrolase